MAAYVILDIEITDPVGYQGYGRLASPTVAAYGGTYVVRGGAFETLEGDWTPKRLVVLEFPSVAQAKAWWDSPEYRAPREMRQRTTNSKVVVVAGV
jgi:uncharacterized protein (DUF1330 family)